MDRRELKKLAYPSAWRNANSDPGRSGKGTPEMNVQEKPGAGEEATLDMLAREGARRMIAAA